MLYGGTLVRAAEKNPHTKLFSTTDIANRSGHGKIVMKVVASPAAIAIFGRQQSVLSVLSSRGGVSPNFWRNLPFCLSNSLSYCLLQQKRGSAKWLAEPPFSQSFGGTF